MATPDRAMATTAKLLLANVLNLFRFISVLDANPETPR
jgi:hypothetical protein